MNLGNSCSFGTKLCDRSRFLAVQEAAKLFFARDLADKSGHRTCLYWIRKRGHGMRSLSRIGCALALAFLNIQPAFPQVKADTLYRENVEYEDGKISIDFDQTPLGVALSAIQVKTGLQITVPPATESRLLNLRLSRL